MKRYLLIPLIFLVVSSFAQTGCTDYQATNFDPTAVVNDGSCIYPLTTLPLVIKCEVDSAHLSETSGIVNQNGNFWTHVDDANASIYRIDTVSDAIFQKVGIINATNNDWEDVSSDSNYIYIGDIGNNNGNRTDLCFYKVLKSDLTPTASDATASKINFTYADQVNFTPNHNYNFYECEAFFVMHDSIHMFTKGWVNRWTKHYVLPAAAGTQVAHLVDSFFVNSLITSAAIQGDTLVVLLGINFWGGSGCYVWRFNDFQGSHFFNGNKRRFNLGYVSYTGQAEGICFSDTNRGYITNESYPIPAQLKAFDLNPYLQPAPHTPLISINVDSVSQSLKACSDTGSITFRITNTAVDTTQILNFTIDSLPPWVTASPMADSIAPGDTALITLSFNSEGMQGGNYFTNIVIESNDFYNPIQSILCSLHVDNNPCLDFVFNSDTCTGIVDFMSQSINSPTTYFWDFGDGDTSSSANPIHSYSANGNYTTVLIGCNSSGCDSVVEHVHAAIRGLNVLSCTPVTQSWCCGIGITRFQVTGPTGFVIDNISNDASMGYEDFTCFDHATMITSNPYTLTCTTGNTFAEYLKVWLDLNGNGTFDLPSEELYSDLDSVAPIHSGSFMIPALPGNVYGQLIRMRVASDFQQMPSPCGNPVYGQHEDYSVLLNFAVTVNDPTVENGVTLFPNPFKESATIEYDLKHVSNIKLEIFNILGESVSVPVNSEEQFPGKYEYTFSEHSPGIYFVALTVNGVMVVRRLTHL